jgi:phospholipase C
VRDPEAHIRNMKDYFDDAEAGRLPQVAFVSSTFDTKLPESTWEHAPHLPTIGQQWVARVIDALTRSPDWARSALFLTYDEHGGLWDHVVPPPACAPDSLLPQIGEHDVAAGFNQLGIRVPMMAVSPFAKKHYVSHQVYDHTSILRFIEARFVIGAISARDANAEAPWDMFDFTDPPHADPPAIEVPAIDGRKVVNCMRKFPKI